MMTAPGRSKHRFDEIEIGETAVFFFAGKSFQSNTLKRAKKLGIRIETHRKGEIVYVTRTA